MYLEPGNSIGEYRLVRRLGRGATGLVYQALDLPANKLLLEYAYRTSGLANALEETAVRLNVAALSLRLKNRVAALQELKRVVDVVAEGRIPQPLSDSIGGTAQYLTGLAAEASGDVRGAEAAWRQAAQSQGTLLIEDSGEPVKDLAEQHLNQASATRGSSRP